jgi:hypothetical protein
VVGRWGGGSGAQKNKSASPLFPHRRQPSRWRLRGDGNVCCLVLQIATWSSCCSSGEICFLVCHRPTLAAGARWFPWREDVSPEVVDLPFFSDFVDGRRWVLVQDSTGTSPVDVAHQHVPSYVQHACLSTHKASVAMVLSWIRQWYGGGSAFVPTCVSAVL